MLPYQISREENGNTSVSAFINGRLRLADSSHENFKEIVGTLIGQEEGRLDEGALLRLFDISLVAGQRFERYSDRVMVHDGRVYFDGVEVDNALTKSIVGFIKEDREDFRPLVNFMEKLAMNPNPHSIEHAYRWLNQHHFTITSEGDIIAYKGLRADYLSDHSGTAIVDGEVVIGRIPNRPGSIIQMPRDQVEFDPSNGCSVGLHAADFGFARGWAGGVLTVSLKVHPRDIVSVPTEAGASKMRVCQYEVLEEVHRADERFLAEDEHDDEDHETDEQEEQPDTAVASGTLQSLKDLIARFTRGRDE